MNMSIDPDFKKMIVEGVSLVLMIGVAVYAVYHIILIWLGGRALLITFRKKVALDFFMSPRFVIFIL